MDKEERKIEGIFYKTRRKIKEFSMSQIRRMAHKWEVNSELETDLVV